ncbi:MAG: hypothetical protein Q9186_001931 [Xanthomendoza sp. 1 TL-2023]
MPSQPFIIPSTPKPIHCILSHPPTIDSNPPTPSLIFTHGAGGTLTSDAIANFTTGFSHHLPLLTFQGTIHLPTRTKTFSTIISHQENLPPSTALGGRSMGTRAAVMAASPETTHLVLISYPLHTAKDQTRDQILLDINPSTHVLFVSGDHDSMCNLSRLESVRSRMQCPTWMIIVRGADHGMNVKPKKFTEAVGVKTGEIVAGWMQGKDEKRREGMIFCDDEDGEVEWTGWRISVDDDKKMLDSASALASNNNNNNNNNNDIPNKVVQHIGPNTTSSTSNPLPRTSKKRKRNIKANNKSQKRQSTTQSTNEEASISTRTRSASRTTSTS